MKKCIGLLVFSVCMPAVAVEGYQDIYLDKKKDIVIHGLMCGDNLNNLNQLKPSAVYTNTPEIEKGTYYYQSAYGEFSYTFNTSDNEAVMVRGLLSSGKTTKDDMVKQLCIVKYVAGLPQSLKKYLTKTTLKASDANRDKMMKNYVMVTGKPAFGKGKY